MWNRKELKARGKAAVKRNYWKSVVVGLIDAFILAEASIAFHMFDNFSTDSSVLEGASGEVLALVGTSLLIMILIATLLQFVFNSLLLGPLQVGTAQFKLNALNGTGNISDLGKGFDSNYKNTVKTMFLMDLYLCLWSLLLVIPGIVKAYEYRMVPYILAENPSMDSKDVFAASRAMMNGNKWNTFVLDLSFILWQFLSGITFGLVGVFYSNPYQGMTTAALYETLKTNA